MAEGGLRPALLPRPGCDRRARGLPALPPSLSPAGRRVVLGKWLNRSEPASCGRERAGRCARDSRAERAAHSKISTNGSYF